MDEEEPPKKKKSFWKTALKWTFRIAVMGIGLGIASELIIGGVFHGQADLSQFLLKTATDFVDPFMQSASAAITADGSTIDTALSPVTDFLKAIHEFFGYEDTMEPATLDIVEDNLVTGGGSYDSFGASDGEPMFGNLGW